ncbi:pyridoxamine 5'-phosphate oxidase family protein [Thermoanaerobacterium sp. CMT5567-10]|uniref:pyridoxamine 5'-phosphate oxidase family protein n=1 Tax=Thermoanaerobacterium sp. CMT5567-10 TaxID=3061989 RepID=UPI0026DED6AF|nr:pyridoxamine 5'-phosphate oxidase family protein [Thermoanaerobacterium sp. CMT5567-10]WKV08492.1 pyridoxamine 5'-phosphate oxidase family protein [Thermoanaerobacterium sp. CMT5567-10]
MEEVLQFLKDNPTFYIATVDGDTPKVRPFGFAMEYEGKLCFCTNNQKDVYKQLKANPKFEISVASKTGEWLRLKGKAVFITSRESKKAALDTMPSLRNLYNEEDSIFEIFYADEAEATFYCMNGPVKTVKI